MMSPVATAFAVVFRKPRQPRCTKVDMKSVVASVLSRLLFLIVSLVFNVVDSLHT